MNLSSADILQKQMETMRHRFITVLDEHLDKLDIYREQIKEDAKSEDAFAQVQFIAHKVAGTASTLGFIEIGRDASRAENKTIEYVKSGFNSDTLDSTLEIIDEFIEQASNLSSKFFWENQ